MFAVRARLIPRRFDDAAPAADVRPVFRNWPILALVALLCGCAAQPAQNAPASSPAIQAADQSSPSKQAGDAAQSLAGLWEGTSTSVCMPMQPDISRCNAVQKITLQIFQDGSKLTGYYTCAFGNTVCRDTNTTGKIGAGTARQGGLALRVMLPDGSSCLYNGRLAQHNPNEMRGSYFCMQGGGYLERGSFQVQRSY
jgi:hypothetical protein